jgi:aerobic-type carbon monoxide dehydrogenase small subunit (CoxS/CutS family)
MRKEISMRELITLHVNGERHEVAVLLHHTLLEVLREDMGLIGTKHGCELAGEGFSRWQPLSLYWLHKNL